MHCIEWGRNIETYLAVGELGADVVAKFVIQVAVHCDCGVSEM